MIEIPEKIYNGVFEKEFKRGSVLKTLFRGDDGKQRLKYFIILSHDPSQDPAISVLTTSKTTFYDKYPQFNKDIVRISAQALKIFPRETIINCREVRKLSKQTLRNNFRAGTLRFIGILPPRILQNIDNIITQSFFISPSDKKLILGQ